VALARTKTCRRTGADEDQAASAPELNRGRSEQGQAELGRRNCEDENYYDPIII
jgi:hypothetical protein